MPEAKETAGQARDGHWTHEEHIAAAVSREVAPRWAFGAEVRARSTGSPARKSLEECQLRPLPLLGRTAKGELM